MMMMTMTDDHDYCECGATSGLGTIHVLNTEQQRNAGTTTGSIHLALFGDIHFKHTHTHI